MTGSDSRSNIKVCVRVRPENERERHAGEKPSVAVVNESILVFDPQYEEQGLIFLSFLPKWFLSKVTAAAYRTCQLFMLRILEISFFGSHTL